MAKIFQVKNEKIGFFNRPFYYESEQEALAYLNNVLMSDADRALHSLKDDLSLYYMGDIDFVTGCISPIEESYYEGDVCVVRYGIKICDLRDIFDSIPSDRIPQTANELRDAIKDLGAVVSTLKKDFSDYKEFVDVNYKKVKH